MLAALLFAAHAAVATSAGRAALAPAPVWTPAAGPWIAEAGVDHVEVRWVSDVDSDPGALVVGSNGHCGDARPIKPTVKDGIARVTVEGLDPAAPKDYCVRRSGETVPARLETLPKQGESARLVVFGDTRSDTDAHSRVIARIVVENPDAVVNTGDLVENGMIDAQWRDFLKIERDLLSSTPLLAAPGNHDEHDLAARSLLERYFPRPPWWEATVGTVRILFVDSNRALDGGSTQGEWLRDRLAAADADRSAGRIRWIVAVHHHPAFSSAHHGSEPAVRRELVPLYERYGVDVVFSGHDHDYERVEHGGVTYVVTGGGGAPLYPFQPVPLPGSTVRAVAHHYVRVDASVAALSMVAIDSDGNVIDRFERHPGERRADAPAREPASTLPAVGAALAFAAISAWLASGRLAA